MNLELIRTIITMYLSANEETKQEIKDVIKYLDSLHNIKIQTEG